MPDHPPPYEKAGLPNLASPSVHYNYGNFSINSGQKITQYIGSSILPGNEEQAKELERLRQELRALGGRVSIDGRDEGVESQIANRFNPEGGPGENRQRGAGIGRVSSENFNTVSLSILHSCSYLLPII